MAKLPKGLPKPKTPQLVSPANVVPTPKSKPATMPAFRLKRMEEPTGKHKKK